MLSLGLPILLQVSLTLMNLLQQSRNGEYGLMLWNTSPLVLVETEELLYGLSSFIAEVGGILGLFLGFSFMTIWDGIEEILPFLAKKFKTK